MKYIDPEFKSQSSIYESLDAAMEETNQLENKSVNNNC